mmetsp:Transcript_1892/g.2791  ORF Transcript_1892/g.2791 Transcript_1892/m.2791 type:complete len:91 (+) Transcript_1892:913-1185(+)
MSYYCNGCNNENQNYNQQRATDDAKLFAFLRETYTMTSRNVGPNFFYCRKLVMQMDVMKILNILCDCHSYHVDAFKVGAEQNLCGNLLFC